MSLWNCDLLIGLLSIAWATDAWIWNIGGMITKRRNWKTEKSLYPCDSVHNTFPKRTAMRLNVAIWWVTTSHINSTTFTHPCKCFPPFVMYFFPLYSFHLRFSLITLFLLFATLSFSSAYLFFLALQCATFEPCLTKRTDECPRIITIQIPKHLWTRQTEQTLGTLKYHDS
jgi:hypothetical protein